VHAYDVKTGKKVWDFWAGSSGLNTVYPGWPFNTPMAIADGKVYATTGHAYNPPLFKGAKLYCINATDGNPIWDVLGFYNYNGIAIADGYLVVYNNYDGRVYCYGKSPSATTVTASPKVSVRGNNVLIEGTVTDQSSGETCLGKPTAGTPAISDDTMSQWMEYLYMQQPMPTNATGVEVTLDTVDPNGNFVHIDTVRSDMSGMYKKAFVPEVPGEYTIIATFAGSKSYGSSYAETAIDVQEAPPPTAAPEKLAFPATENYVIGVGVAIIIAIAIVGLLLFKKK
jgi:outer membrane protein assembly factor BamB